MTVELLGSSRHLQMDMILSLLENAQLGSHYLLKMTNMLSYQASDSVDCSHRAWLNASKTSSNSRRPVSVALSQELQPELVAFAAAPGVKLHSSKKPDPIHTKQQVQQVVSLDNLVSQS